MPKETENPYLELESLTLQLLCRLISSALEDPSSTPRAALLGTAVSLLRAGQVPANSTAQQREASGTSASWFHDLPDEAKAKLLEHGGAAKYISTALEDKAHSRDLAPDAGDSEEE